MEMRNRKMLDGDEKSADEPQEGTLNECGMCGMLRSQLQLDDILKVQRSTRMVTAL